MITITFSAGQVFGTFVMPAVDVHHVPALIPPIVTV